MRFENMESEMVYTIRGKCSVYYASRVGVFFEKSFLRAEDCAEGYFRRDTEPLPKERLTTSIDTSKKNDNVKDSPR